MTDHKGSKWAKRILELQQPDGMWGQFHSLSRGAVMTTEQALRRLQILGYTVEDACIRRAVEAMEDCLLGRRVLPDRRAKTHNWDIFTDMMLACWIRRFTPACPAANRIAGKWAQVVTAAVQSGAYVHADYCAAYRAVFGEKPRGGRLEDFVNFYPVSLVAESLTPEAEARVFDHILHHAPGIYYIYDDLILHPPEPFESRKASRYLGAVELLALYRGQRAKLGFAVDWLYANRNERGWDMGAAVNDGVYFPLSDDWRRKGAREADCTERVFRLLRALGDDGKKQTTDCACQKTDLGE